MAPQKTAQEGDIPMRQVNNILQNLRGEHYRHARNVQRKSPITTRSLSSHAHNQPTLPVDLIYSSCSSAPATSISRVPGPSPPRSWQLPAISSLTSTLSPIEVDGDVANAPAWRERALSLFFSTNVTPSRFPPENARSHLTYPDPSPIPQLTLLCLQLIRATCSRTDLARVVPYIPLHLRRTLLRYAAVHAPLSQIELDALCEGTTHVDTELVVVGPCNTLHGRAFRKNYHTTDDVHHHNHHHPDELECGDGEPDESWDAVRTHQDNEHMLRSLAVLSSPLSAATVLAFPPTITRLALVRIPHRIPLHRLPTICPLLVLLDLSYNAWLYTSEAVDSERSILEVEWCNLRRLEVLGLRGGPVSPTLPLELNRGRWKDVRIIQ